MSIKTYWEKRRGFKVHFCLVLAFSLATLIFEVAELSGKPILPPLYVILLCLFTSFVFILYAFRILIKAEKHRERQQKQQREEEIARVVEKTIARLQAEQKPPEE